MQTWEAVYDVEPGTTVVIDQMGGAVTVTGWDRPQVQVKATWSEGTIDDRLMVSRTDGRLSLAVQPWRTGLLGFLRSDSQLDLELQIPTGARCEVDCGSGTVLVQGTKGPVAVDCGSGNVTVWQVAGELDVETGSGRIEVQDVAGVARLEAGSGSISARRLAQGVQGETGSGSITVADVAGEVDLETGSGSISLCRVVAPAVRLETGSGSLRAEALDTRRLSVETGSGSVTLALLRVHPDGEYEVTTGSGRVAVALPTEADLQVDLNTSSRVDWSGLAVRELRRDDHRVVGQLNGGGPRLAVDCNGPVSLQPLTD